MKHLLFILTPLFFFGQENKAFEQLALEYFIENIYSEQIDEPLVFSGYIENKTSSIDNICLIEIVEEILINYRNKEVPLKIDKKDKNDFKLYIENKNLELKRTNLWRSLFPSKKVNKIKVYNMTQFLDWFFVEIQLIKTESVSYFYFDIDVKNAKIKNYCENKFFN
jgi:hypothetical protein